MKIRGTVKMIKNGIVIYEDHNTINDSVFSDGLLYALAMAYSGAASRPIYRFAFGYDSTLLVNPTVEEDSWALKNSFGVAIGSQDITTQTPVWAPVPGILAIENVTTIAAVDYAPGDLGPINEIALIAGSGASGVELGDIGFPGTSDPAPAGNYFFSYRVIPETTILDGESLTFAWNIELIKDY